MTTVATTSFVVTSSSKDEIKGTLNFLGTEFDMTFTERSALFGRRVHFMADYRNGRNFNAHANWFFIEYNGFVFEFSVSFSDSDDSFVLKSFTVTQFVMELDEDGEEELIEIESVTFYF